MPEPYGGGGRGADAVPAVFVADAGAVSTAGVAGGQAGVYALRAGVEAGAEVCGEVLLVVSAGLETES